MPYQKIHPALQVSSSANFNNIIENTRFIDGAVTDLESKNTDQAAWRDTVPQPAHEDIEVKLRDLENYYGIEPSPLNSNTGFETDLSPWQAIGATFERSTNAWSSGSYSAKVTPDGSNNQAYIYTEMVPVTAAALRAESWVYFSTTGTANVSVNWFDVDGGYITTSSNTESLVAGESRFVGGAHTPPSGAVTATMNVVRAGQSTDFDTFYVDDAAIRPSRGLFGATWQTNNLFDISSGSNVYGGWDTELSNSGGVRMENDTTVRIEVAGVWAIDATVMVVNESTSNNFGIWIGLDAYNGWAKSGGEELDERQVSCIRYFNEGDYFVIGYYSTNSISLQNNSMQPMLHAYRLGSGEPPVRPQVENPWTLGESELGVSTTLA